eukprot:8690581-Lingulodinium_polyedra.AAC.1
MGPAGCWSQHGVLGPMCKLANSSNKRDKRRPRTSATRATMHGWRRGAKCAKNACLAGLVARREHARPGNIGNA